MRSFLFIAGASAFHGLHVGESTKEAFHKFGDTLKGLGHKKDQGPKVVEQLRIEDTKEGVMGGNRALGLGFTRKFNQLKNKILPRDSAKKNQGSEGGPSNAGLKKDMELNNGRYISGGGIPKGPSNAGLKKDMELNNGRYISGGGIPKGGPSNAGLKKDMELNNGRYISGGGIPKGRALAAAKPIGAFVMGIPSNAAKALAKKASNLAKDAGSKIKDAGSKIKALFHGNNGGPTPATTVPPQ